MRLIGTERFGQRHLFCLSPGMAAVSSQYMFHSNASITCRTSRDQTATRVDWRRAGEIIQTPNMQPPAIWAQSLLQPHSTPNRHRRQLTAAHAGCHRNHLERRLITPLRSCIGNGNVFFFKRTAAKTSDKRATFQSESTTREEEVKLKQIRNINKN